MNIQNATSITGTNADATYAFSFGKTKFAVWFYIKEDIDGSSKLGGCQWRRLDEFLRHLVERSRRRLLTVNI